MKKIICCGINHRTAPLVIRERLAFNNTLLIDALHDLRATSHIQEAVLVATCNRVEVYAVTEHVQCVIDWLQGYLNLNQQALHLYIYQYPGLHAIEHLLSVASGLDSMVLGEPQVFGQLKSAYAKACEVQSAGTCLRQLFPLIFASAKKIRHQTGIGRYAASLASIAVKLAKQQLHNLQNANVLLIGAGSMIEQVAHYLCSEGVAQIIVANRTVDKARSLAAQVNGYGIKIGDIAQYLNNIDMVLTCTASQLPILGKSLLETVSKQRPLQPLLIIDLAVPRDVEREASQLDNIYLYDIDDLECIAADNNKAHTRAAQAARMMIKQAVKHLEQQLQVRTLSGNIQHYRARAKQFCDDMIDQALTQLDMKATPQVLTSLAQQLTQTYVSDHFVHHALLDETYKHEATKVHDEEIKRALLELEKDIEIQNIIHSLARRLTQKLLHSPTLYLRQTLIAKSIDL